MHLDSSGKSSCATCQRHCHKRRRPYVSNPFRGRETSQPLGGKHHEKPWQRSFQTPFVEERLRNFLGIIRGRFLSLCFKPLSGKRGRATGRSGREPSKAAAEVSNPFRVREAAQPSRFQPLQIQGFLGVNSPRSRLVYIMRKSLLLFCNFWLREKPSQVSENLAIAVFFRICCPTLISKF